MGPTYYSLDRGGWHLVIYPDEDYFFGDECAAMKRRWLEADLRLAAGSKRILLAQHTPPRNDWLDFLAARGVEVVIFGHWHSSKCYRHGAVLVLGTPPSVFGGIDYTPRGFRRIELGRAEPRTSYTPLRSAHKHKQKARGNLAVLWEMEAGANLHRGQPLVTGEQVLVPVPDEELQGRAGVLCLDAVDGKRRWFAPSTDSVRGSLATNKRLVFAVTQPGEVLAIDRASGELVWSQRLAGFPERWIYNGPAVAGKVVVAGTGGGGIEALDVQTGQRQWSWKSSKYSGDSWSHYATPLAFGNRIAVMVHRAGVSCLSAGAGRLLWHFDCEYEYLLADILHTGQALLMPGLPDRFYKIDARTGKRLWTRRTGGGKVVAWNSDGKLLVLNTTAGVTEGRRATCGRALWRFEHGKDLLDMVPYGRAMSSAIAKPVLTSNGPLVGGADGVVKWLDEKTGKLRGSLDLGEVIVAATSAGEDTAIFTTWDGRVICVGPSPQSSSHR